MDTVYLKDLRKEELFIRELQESFAINYNAIENDIALQLNITKDEIPEDWNFNY